MKQDDDVTLVHSIMTRIISAMRPRFLRTTVVHPQVVTSVITIMPHHICVPKRMENLCVSVDISIDPWEDDTVLKVYPSIPRGSNQCLERLYYLQRIDYEAYEKSKTAGECPPRPMSLD
jgi:hypothetical protein